ncbi:DNA lyase [filamentous cyanobacterium CCP5]|nr:DNA lyase [filamentous cyanobacterium CCP5]
MTEAFDIDVAMQRVREAVQPFRPAAMFELAEAGVDSLFEQLVACIISIRTYDEVSVPVAKQLFERARTPAEMQALTPAETLACIRQSTFADRKADQIHRIAAQIQTDYGGDLPPDPKILMGFSGVGPKCAHLALGVALGYPCISVDIHVHRVTNRWGYVNTKSPEKTMQALEAKLPKQHWVEINRLLVPFGKHICRGTAPRCGDCPLAAMCPSAGTFR